MKTLKPCVQILVVDDESTLRETVKLLLEHDGHKVQTAASGEAALALLAQHRFDLVMTDFSMPGMHGDQLAARIRQILPAQPIIMATAFAEEYKVFGQTPDNLDALLYKPFSLQELRDVIEQVLTRESSAQNHDLRRTVESSSAPSFPETIPPSKL